MRSFGLQAIAPSSETVPITKDEWYKIKDTCNHWFSLMDFDRTGLMMSRKLRDLYNIQPLLFNNFKPLTKKLKDGSSGQFTGAMLAKNYQGFPTVKDFYDYVKAFGKDKTIELINNTREFYQDRFDAYDKEMYENLKWINNKYKTTHYAPF